MGAASRSFPSGLALNGRFGHLGGSDAAPTTSQIPAYAYRDAGRERGLRNDDAQPGGYFAAPMQNSHWSARRNRQPPATAGLALNVPTRPNSFVAINSNFGLAATTNVRPPREV